MPPKRVSTLESSEKPSNTKSSLDEDFPGVGNVLSLGDTDGLLVKGRTKGAFKASGLVDGKTLSPVGW